MEFKKIYEREIFQSNIKISNLKLPNYSPYVFSFHIFGTTNFSHQQNDNKIFMGTATQNYELIVSTIFGDNVDILINEQEYHEHWINSLQFSFDNRNIFTSSEDHSILIYDFENQKKLKRITMESIPISLKTNRDSNIIDVCSGDHLYLFDSRTTSNNKIKFKNDLICSEVNFKLFFKFLILIIHFKRE